MSHHDEGNGVSRRKVLECMTWAGTGVLWTITGGVPRSLGIVDSAMAAEAPGMTFLQISDSHTGFDRPANPNVPIKYSDSPFVKYADYGIKVDLAKVCEPPRGEVVNNLLQSWQRSQANR